MYLVGRALLNIILFLKEKGEISDQQCCQVDGSSLVGQKGFQ